MASLLARSAFRAATLRHVGASARPSASVFGLTKGSLRRRQQSTFSLKSDEENKNLLLGSVVFAGATAIIAIKQHGFSWDKIADEYYAEKRKAENAAKVTEEVAEEAAEEGMAEAERVEEAEAPKETVEVSAVPVDLSQVAEVDFSSPYVLIGAGAASFAATKAIHEKDPNSKVLIIGEEEHPPYMRPPLSKELWFTDSAQAANLTFKDWNGKERDIYFQPRSFYADEAVFLDSPEGSVGLLAGVKVLSIDVDSKRLRLSNGKTVQYSKLLIATGGRPKNLQVFEDAEKKVKEKVTLYRNVADFHHLDSLAKSAKSITIVGSGFLGSELAVALGHTAKKGGLDLEVNQVFREEGNMGRIFPTYLSQWTTQRVSKEGVNVRPRSVIEAATATDDNRVQLTFADGSTLVTDHVLVAVGIVPNTELAGTAGLEIDPNNGGIMVNAELAGRTDVYVAGDVASFHDPALGRRRVEHHDQAVVSGRLAGQNMADSELRKPYRHQSMFWSDLGPLVGYEAIGIIDSSLETVSVWAMATPDDAPKERQDTEKAAGEGAGAVEGIEEVTETGQEQGVQTDAPTTAEGTEAERAASAPEAVVPLEEYGKGVVFYLRDKKVAGILLWNIFGKIPTARRIIGERRTVEDPNDLAKYFNVHG